MKLKAWSVLTQDDGVFVEHHCGTDKAKVRNVAAKLLHEKKKPVLIIKPGKLSVLTPDHLQSQLPKESF
jgi:hypothetical protein